MAKRRVLILSSAESSTNVAINDQFVKSLNRQFGDSFETEWHHYRNVRIKLGMDGMQVTLPEKQQIDAYDLVYFKSYYRYFEVAVSIAEYLNSTGVAFVCSELKKYISLSKLSQYTRLSLAGIRIPQTLFMDTSHLRNSFDELGDELGIPFVLKAIDAKGGDANYLLSDGQKLTEILDKHSDKQFVAQRFIENDGDMRLLVLNNKIRLVISRRSSSKDTHLHNTSQGGRAEEISIDKLDNSVNIIALKAAKLMDREIAGVDVMFDSATGDPYVLEINASPQVASGALVSKKIEKYGEMFLELLDASN